MPIDDELTVKTTVPTVDEINARLSQAMRDPMIGAKLAGDRYEILDVLGEGGMSVVYKAKQALVDRIVAIKTLKVQMMHDPTLIRRFDREIKTLSRLNHPNIVTVYDCVVSDQGQPYFVMDYLQGASLQEILAEPQNHNRISPGRAKNLFLQVCNAVDHAHRNGIVHRDLKPGNIMVMDISGQDFVKVVDFGLAKIGEDAQRLTQTGEIWGSPLYMSPEQCNGQELDARSDIYSLGAVMYESLTGSVPFSGKSFLETIQKVLNNPTPPFSATAPDVTIPPAIEAIVSRCLAKDPDQRYQTMAELKDAIDHTFPADGEALVRSVPPGKVIVDKGAAIQTKELQREIDADAPTKRLRRDPAPAAQSSPARSNSSNKNAARPAKQPGESSNNNPMFASIVGGLIVASALIAINFINQSNPPPAVAPATTSISPAPPRAPATTGSVPVAPVTTAAPVAAPASALPKASNPPAAQAAVTKFEKNPDAIPTAVSPNPASAAVSGQAGLTAPVVAGTQIHAPSAVSASENGLHAMQGVLDNSQNAHSSKPAPKAKKEPAAHKAAHVKVRPGAPPTLYVPRPRSGRELDDTDTWNNMRQY